MSGSDAQYNGPGVALNPRGLWAIAADADRVRCRVIRVQSTLKSKRGNAKTLAHLRNPTALGQAWTTAETETKGCDTDSLVVVVGELLAEAMEAGAGGRSATPSKHSYSGMGGRSRRKIHTAESREELLGMLNMVVPDPAQPRWTLVRKVGDTANGKQQLYILADRDPATGLCSLIIPPSLKKYADFVLFFDEWVSIPAPSTAVQLTDHIKRNILQFCSIFTQGHESENSAGNALPEAYPGEEEEEEEAGGEEWSEDDVEDDGAENITASATSAASPTSASSAASVADSDNSSAPAFVSAAVAEPTDNSDEDTILSLKLLAAASSSGFEIEPQQPATPEADMQEDTPDAGSSPTILWEFSEREVITTVKAIFLCLLFSIVMCVGACVAQGGQQVGRLRVWLAGRGEAAWEAGSGNGEDREEEQRG